MHRLLVSLVVVALVGCGGGAPPPPKGGPPVSKAKTADAAKADLFRIAEKFEDPATVESLKKSIAEFEKPDTDWKWEHINDHVMNGGYTIQTKAAYEKYRSAKTTQK